MRLLKMVFFIPVSNIIELGREQTRAPQSLSLARSLFAEEK